MTTSDLSKILIVDDDEEWHIRLQTVLRNQGYEFVTASDYQEAITKLSTEKFDLALVNAILHPVIKPGWLLDWTMVLGVAQEVKTSVIVVTEGVDSTPEMQDVNIKEFLNGYGVCGILYKSKVHLLTIRKEVQIAIQNRRNKINQVSQVNGTEKTCILFLAATPDDQDALHLDIEVRTIDERLRTAEFRDRFELVSHLAVRYSDLSELLLRYKPHIVHFSGHGSKSGKIVLQNESGNAETVEPTALKDLLRIVQRNICCVVLNACYSQDQAKAIAQEIDCVVGMSREFDDAAAIRFSAGFYRGIGYGLSIKKAFELGKNEIDLSKFSDADVPQLLVKPGVDPAEIKFF